jgi:hypothetical protein
LAEEHVDPRVDQGVVGDADWVGAEQDAQQPGGQQRAQAAAIAPAFSGGTATWWRSHPAKPL